MAIRVTTVCAVKVLLPLSALLFPLAPLRGQHESGIASYYSRGMTGALTANGERLHHDSLTCAHRTYPFGTFLRVVNPATGKAVVVRVNDRGPFVRGRVIDLSWRAARELGILAQGLAKVTVTPTGSYPYIVLPLDSLHSKVEFPSIYDEMRHDELPLISPLLP